MLIFCCIILFVYIYILSLYCVHRTADLPDVTCTLNSAIAASAVAASAIAASAVAVLVIAATAVAVSAVAASAVASTIASSASGSIS